MLWGGDEVRFLRWEWGTQSRIRRDVVDVAPSCGVDVACTMRTVSS